MVHRFGARLAVLDIGSNTIRAIAAAVEADGRLRIFGDEFAMTALGRGLERTGHMPEDAIRATVDFAAHFLEGHGPVDTVFAVGTAACRDAANTARLHSALLDRCGAGLEVLSGEEEARLTYLGAISAFSGDAAQGLLVADIGGRSMELATARDGAVCGISIPLGARALTEEYLRDDPPSPAQVSAARAHAAEVLRTAGEMLTTSATFIAAGGTACAAALLAGDRWILSLRQIASLRRELCGMPLQLRRERLTSDPERAEVVCAGLIALELYATRAPERRVGVSKGGIREGVLLDRTGAAAFVASL